MEGTLIDSTKTVVRLKKSSGVVINVPFDRLSFADQQFVQALHQPGVSAHNPVTAGLAYITEKPIVSDAIAAVHNGAMFVQSPGKVPENMIYLRLSQKFLQRLAAHDVSQRRNVNGNILSSTVTGVSQTEGTSEVALQSNSKFGELELLFSGATTYHTVADAGPIQVSVSGVTQFASSKAVWIDEQGIHIGPAATNTLTTSTITGIQTTLPGLRGRIALRIGGARAAESQPEAREITGEHTKRQINDGFDETASKDVAQLWKELCTQIAALPADDPLRPHGWEASTTKDALQIVFLSRRGEGRVSPPPVVDNQSDLVVQINSAVVSRALTDVDLHKLLQPNKVRVASLSGPMAGEGSAMHWSNDRQWLAVSWSKSSRSVEPESQSPRVASQVSDNNP